MAHHKLNLFEFKSYGWDQSPELSMIKDKEQFSDDFEIALKKIWKDRKRFIINYNDYYNSESSDQRIVDFNKHEIIPRNWIGSVYFRSGSDEYEVNFLPKIFYDDRIESGSVNTESIFVHVLWWLSISDNQNYMSLSRASGAMGSSLLEVMIHIFSVFTLNVLTTGAYNYYERMTDDLGTVRGQIDFNGYTSNFARGNKHIVTCTFDSFQYDNIFNRIIKYVCTFLSNTTQNKYSKNNLLEILFILSDVESSTVSSEDCDKVVLNPIHTEYKSVLDYCRLFLDSMSVFKWKDDFDVFALLMPSEKLFENFIFSVLKQNSGPLIKSVSKKKPGRNYLVRQLPSESYNKYKMLNDMVVKLNDGKHILFDMKYKKIFDKSDEEETDLVNNISQSDIYQMVSYAIGSGVSNIGLIFPSLPSDRNEELPIYEIKDELSDEKIIRILPFKIDIVHPDGLHLDTSGNLENLFETSLIRVSEQLNKAVSKISNFGIEQKNLFE